ncbi:MAG: hypothetical protein PHV77_02035 [Candidatus Omnitrophica bacterium]|jgi:hypothetical protein|nr:hypothetical protein [Candidatus Omnitrophota bacterium]
MKTLYECQICKNIVQGPLAEWCPKCAGHRVIFKRIILDDDLAMPAAQGWGKSGSIAHDTLKNR